uniref:Transposase n=1 Tax=Acrobeloides nanus TaxID=290746 RepID=A0A914DV54_9BILA
MNQMTFENCVNDFRGSGRDYLGTQGSKILQAIEAGASPPETSKIFGDGRNTVEMDEAAVKTYGQWQRHWVFQQDGAPSHKAEETQNLIRDNVPGFIEVDINPQRNNGEWPPNSLDLSILDYSLWSILEAEACSKPHQSVEALKKSLVKAWNAIPQEVIDRIVNDFPKRLKKCIDARGDHFENK